jgi:hypothetical protein
MGFCFMSLPLDELVINALLSASFLLFFQNGLKYGFFQFSSRQISTVYKYYRWISMLGSSM